MARLLLLLAVVLLPVVLVNATIKGTPFHIHGHVYCDTCQCGFETSATYYIPGATVRIVCKQRENMETTYTMDGVTDSTGSFNIKVEDDKGDQICYTKLVSSPVADCKTPDLGRDRSQIILTRSNGAISNLHYSNALGFRKEKPLAGCSELLKKYLPYDEA
ncbi:hypothetical protein QYF36_000053 [Acer negundo]|nr:hypothetical protein QYF36_000053 [Acer negundo]